MQAELSPSETSDRLVSALRMLFEVCEALKLERAKTMEALWMQRQYCCLMECRTSLRTPG